MKKVGLVLQLEKGDKIAELSNRWYIKPKGSRYVYASIDGILPPDGKVLVQATPFHKASRREPDWDQYMGPAVRTGDDVFVVLKETRLYDPWYGAREFVLKTAEEFDQIFEITKEGRAKVFQEHRLVAVKSIAGRYVGWRQPDIFKLEPFYGLMNSIPNHYFSIPRSHIESIDALETRKMPKNSPLL